MKSLMVSLSRSGYNVLNSVLSMYSSTYITVNSKFKCYKWWCSIRVINHNINQFYNVFMSFKCLQHFYLSLDLCLLYFPTLNSPVTTYQVSISWQRIPHCSLNLLLWTLQNTFLFQASLRTRSHLRIQTQSLHLHSYNSLYSISNMHLHSTLEE
jgi:hypothetical protein